MKTHLPDTPSEMIEVALDDLRKIENDPRYRVEMDKTFHEYDAVEDQCVVCLAGATMAKHVPPLRTTYTTDFDDGQKLAALDFFRCGLITDGLLRLGYAITWSMPSFIDVTPYNEDREKFYVDMQAVIRALRKVGL